MRKGERCAHRLWSMLGHGATCAADLIDPQAAMPVLHTYFRSSADYRVRIALALKRLAYEAAPVHLVRDSGEQHSAAFAALNPAELVQVLVDGLTVNATKPLHAPTAVGTRYSVVHP